MSIKLSGGDRLQTALADMAKRVTKPGTLNVGFLAGATYPDGKPVAMIAAIQEFGAPSRGIPPRPFFRTMIANKSPEWGKQLAGLLVHTEMDATLALNLMGDGIKGQLQQSIVDTNDPPNSARTIARKGAAKPLVDTGHMLQSVGFEVV